MTYAYDQGLDGIVRRTASDFENVMKAAMEGSYDLASELLQQLIDAAVQEQLQQNAP